MATGANNPFAEANDSPINGCIEMQLNQGSCSNRANATEILSEPSAPSMYNFIAYPAIYQQPQIAAAPSATASVLESIPLYADHTPLPQAPHTQLMQSQSPKPYDASHVNLFVEAGPMSPTTSYSTAAVGAAAAAAAGRSSALPVTSNGSSGSARRETKPNQQEPAVNQESAVNHWLVPNTNAMKYTAVWTSVFTLAACFVFAYMAGGYGTYQQSITFLQYNNGTASQSQLTTSWGPSALTGWLRFWRSTPMYSFDIGYLMAWGARHMPSIAAGEWWRLFSSICIHGSFSHLFSNMFALVILAVPLEHTYGPIRIFVIFLAAGFGGTFMSMAFEDPCYVYVGASGAVFGFLGLYLADIMLNFETMYRPLLRLALMLVSLGLTLGIEFATASVNPLLRVSHMSHVGGLIAGLFTSFMFLPNLKDKRWKAARKLANRIGTFSHSIYDRISHGGSAPNSQTHSSISHWGLLARMESCWRRHAWLYRSVWVLSALVLLLMFCGLPVYLWLFRIPSMQCAPLLPNQA